MMVEDLEDKNIKAEKPLAIDTEQRRIVREHTMDDTITVKPTSLSELYTNLSLSDSSSVFQFKSASTMSIPGQVKTLPKDEEMRIESGERHMIDLKPEEAESIEKELLKQTCETRRHNLLISGDISAPVHTANDPLRSDTQNELILKSNKPEIPEQIINTETEKSDMITYNEDIEGLHTQLKDNAEVLLNQRRGAINKLRKEAERELKALQYVPMQIERLEEIPNQIREAIFGIYVCLALNYIDECNETFQDTITEWCIHFLDQLASPALLRLDAHLTKCLKKPILWRTQLLRDGVKVSEMVTVEPLLATLLSYFKSKQQRVDQVYFKVREKMQYEDYEEAPQDSDKSDSMRRTQTTLNESFSSKASNKSASSTPEYTRSPPKMSNPTSDSMISHIDEDGQSGDIVPEDEDEMIIKEDGPSMISESPGDTQVFISLQPPSFKSVFLRDFTTALLAAALFDARVAMLMHRFAALLELNPLLLTRVEENLADDLLAILQANTKECAKQRNWRRLKIAGAAVGGGILIALTAGLAAPGIAAALASLGSVPLSAFLASAGGMAALVSVFGAGGAGLTGWKYSRRIANIKVFEFIPLKGGAPSSLRVGVCISGYLRDDDDMVLPWIKAARQPCRDLHALKWEPAVLKALGGMVSQMLSQNFAVTASKFYLQHTILGGLTVALFWPFALIQYAADLDNTWMVCRERAQQAGKILADAICDKNAVGQRPVTLVGYSIGARVIFYCLQALWKKKKYHCVDSAVLMGLPASLNPTQWRRAREVCSCRLVNVYSRSDWLLAFLYRWMEMRLQVAGLSPVTSVPGIENFDVTGLVKSHASYPERIPEILSFISFDL